jgi:3-dehydroquinate dehydratase-2
MGMGMKKILIVNGPNLNTLGTRQPEIYGSTRFEDWLQEARSRYPHLELVYFQSNHEGDLIDFLQSEGPKADGLVLNAGGLAHTSVVLADAVAALPIPVVEVHISNVFARESFRHHSYLSPVCKGLITGLGLQGYDLAIQSLLS